MALGAYTHSRQHSRIESDFKKPGVRQPAPGLKIYLTEKNVRLLE